MKLNYIYNNTGSIEYVVVPLNIWDKLNVYTEKIEKKTKKNKFNPANFRGLLAHHNFNIEEELQNIREEWKRNI